MIVVGGRRSFRDVISGALAAVEDNDIPTFSVANPVHFAIAIADAPPVSMKAAAVIDLSATDSNDVQITNPSPSNPITITSLGTGVPWVRVQVKFMDPNITVHIPAVVKTYNAGNISIFRALADGSWIEERVLSPTGTAAGVHYTSSQTITVVSASAYVKMWGGSGASSAGNTPNLYNSAGGTQGVGAPGYLEKFLTGLAPGKTLTYTRGAAGVASGGNGGASTLVSGTQTIATLTANGSVGGGTAGGTATGGDINITGQSGALTIPIYGDTGGGVIGQVGQNVGIGGRNGFAYGPDGSYYSPGNAGNPGGLIIEWS
jgi:hypothetical protein